VRANSIWTEEANHNRLPEDKERTEELGAREEQRKATLMFESRTKGTN